MSGIGNLSLISDLWNMISEISDKKQKLRRDTEYEYILRNAFN